MIISKCTRSALLSAHYITLDSVLSPVITAIIIVIFSPRLSDAKATIRLLFTSVSGSPSPGCRLQTRPLIEASFDCGPTVGSPTVI